MTVPAYVERPSRLPGAVLWSGANPVDGIQTVLPDGCMDLLFVGGRVLVAGPDTRAHRVAVDDTPVRALRFAPGQASTMLGSPVDELRDRRVELAALWSDRAARAAAELAERYGARGLEHLALRRFDPSDQVPPVVLAGLRRGAPVGELAAAAGLGVRQLHRRCSRAFGYGPKTLDRILRMQRAVEFAGRGLSLAEVAVRAGYADQAHCSRELRALTGEPPSHHAGASR